MDIRAKLDKIFQQNRAILIQCIVYTFIWGFVAYGQIFLKNYISFDSLSEFIMTETVFGVKCESGRVFWPVYHYLFRGIISYHWLTGLLSLLYVGISVFLVAKLFNIYKKASLIVVSGIFTVNVTLIALAASFIHDMDSYCLALLCSVITVYCWRRFQRGYLYGIIPLVLSLGLYQGYISVAITLIMFICILDLLEGKTSKEVFKNGIKAIAMLIASGLVYLCVVKLVISFYGMRMDSGYYNSLTTSLSYSLSDYVKFIGVAWLTAVRNILLPTAYYSGWITLGIHGLIALTNCGILFLRLMDKKVTLSGKILVCVLLLLLPLGMNISCVLIAGLSHDLMYYAIWLHYLLLLLNVRWFSEQTHVFTHSVRSCVSFSAALLMAICLFGNVKLANMAYTVKEFEHDALLSFMTRVVSKMEEVDDYVPGKTEVAFIGRPGARIGKLPACEQAYNIFGMTFSYPWDGGSCIYYQGYFDYVLLNPISVVSDEESILLRALPDVASMPVYPADGCVEMIGDTLVVKLGE